MADDQHTDQHDQRDADQPDQHEESHDADATDLGDKGKAALKAEREARKAADARAKAAQDELDRLKQEAQQRADAEAAEQGKWQELAEKRDADLTETTGKLEALQARLDTALSVIDTDIAARWKDVPGEVRDLYDGDQDDALAKSAFLTKPATQKLIERLTADTRPGHREDPKGRTDLPKNTDAEKAARARMRPKL